MLQVMECVESREPSIRFKKESERLLSFSRWPSDSPMNKLELVKAGWYYKGEGDCVKCAWCNGGVHRWELGDSALGEHFKYYPNCPFVTQKITEIFSKPSSSLSKNSSVQAVIDLGYCKELVEDVAKKLEIVNTDALLEEIFKISKEKLATAEAPTAEAATVVSTVSTATNMCHEMICKICFDAKVEELFLPCRHLVCCLKCSASVFQCPVCRDDIDCVIKVFLS